MNQLLWSSDFSQSAWVRSAVSIDGTKIVEAASNLFKEIYQQSSLASGTTVTGAYVVSEDTRRYVQLLGPSVVFPEYANFDLQTGARTAGTPGFGSIAPAGDGKYIVSMSATAVSSSSAARIAIALIPDANSPRATTYAGDGTSGIYLHSAALFTGTVTAQQIIDAGGIPVTTSAPASSAVGPQYWQFDGTDDRLTLSSVPFQMTDDHWVVVAGRTDASGARILFSEFNSAGNAFIQCYTSGNSLTAEWRDDASSTSTVAITNTLGNDFVFTQQKKAGAVKARLNSGAFVTNNPTLGVFTLNSASIGSNRFGNYYNGPIYCVIFGKGAISDAELLTLERFAAKLQGRTL